MKRVARLVSGLAALFVAPGALFACGTDSPTTASHGAEGGAPVDGAESVDAAASSGTLTLSLDPTIDGDGDVKATSIATADLLDITGGTIAHATIAAGTAVFGLRAVGAGDYFIEVNGDASNLVPTRIADPNVDLRQRVGQKLRASYIGPADAPTHRINTWSAGQNKGPAVKFTTGEAIPGKQPYVIMTLSPASVELRVLGSAAPLTIFAPAAAHAGVPFDAWILNTNGMDHHGDAFNADGGASACGSCHWDYWRKPVDYVNITPSRGWCFGCHNGTDGSGAGFVAAKE